VRFVLPGLPSFGCCLTDFYTAELCCLSLLLPLKPTNSIVAAASITAHSHSYLPTKHDVVRLSSSVLSMKQQQGYVACQPRADVRGDG